MPGEKCSVCKQRIYADNAGGKDSKGRPLCSDCALRKGKETRAEKIVTPCNFAWPEMS